MNNKFFNSMVFAFTAIVVSVVLTGGCVAQSGAKAPAAQGSGARAQAPAQGSGSSGREAAPGMAAAHPGLMDPTRATEKAPDKFQVKFTTTKGDIVVEVTRAWAPNGADRFYNMCRVGYYKDIAIFRSIKDFMFQFGVHSDPKVSAKWMDSNIQDDPANGISNKPGTLSFAQTARPNSRSVQMFVNMGDNAFLDKARGGGAPFVPFARVVKGMDVLKLIHVTGENDREVQGLFQQRGNDYIKTKYPSVDFIRSAAVSITN